MVSVRILTNNMSPINHVIVPFPGQDKQHGNWTTFIPLFPVMGIQHYNYLAYCRSGNFRVVFFRVRNVRAFNFRRTAKWWKLNVRVRNFRAFNFCRLSNWWKIFQCMVVGCRLFKSHPQTSFCITYCFQYTESDSRLASFPGLPTVQFWITCSMQKQSWKAWVLICSFWSKRWLEF